MASTDSTATQQQQQQQQAAPASASAADGATTTTTTTTETPTQQQQQQGGPNHVSASLYVGDLLPDVTEALLFEFFNAVGPVASVRVCRDAATRRSLGYAYVNFHRLEDAERAIETMNFTAIRGRPCRIMWSHRDPSLRRSGAGNIFVKNLHKDIDHKTLNDTFAMFGEILSCKVATDPKTGESRGYGFIHFEEEEAANAAIEKVDGMMIMDQVVQVAKFKSRKERGADRDRFCNVFVKNLPEEFTSEELEKLFAAHGKITSSMLAPADPPAEGKTKGFGFVNYEDHEAAVKAIEELNGHKIGDKVLTVARAQTKTEREAMLRERFEQQKLERQKKYAGVNLYVKNLNDTVDKEALIETFSQFGSITSARIMEENGKSKGFAFVCFSTPEEATKAVTEMNGKMYEGKPLYVALAQRKDVRRAQLEAQYAAKQKSAMPQMFPAQPPIYGYPQQPMQPRMMYQPQMAAGGRVPAGARGWGGPAGQGMPMGARGPGGMQMMVGYPPMNGQGMPQQQQQQGGQPRGGQNNSNNGRAGQQQQQQPKNYASQVRGGQQQQQRPPQQQQQPQQQGGAPQELTIAALAAVDEATQKQMIGERLYPLVSAIAGDVSGKVTGMLLEMDNSELLHLLDSKEALNEKVAEAKEVLGGSDGAAR